jgi:hypothetical protein
LLIITKQLIDYQKVLRQCSTLGIGAFVFGKILLCLKQNYTINYFPESCLQDINAVFQIVAGLGNNAKKILSKIYRAAKTMASLFQYSIPLV